MQGNGWLLFRENFLHHAEPGFGDSPETGRLVQTFSSLVREQGNPAKSATWCKFESLLA